MHNPTPMLSQQYNEAKDDPDSNSRSAVRQLILTTVPYSTRIADRDEEDGKRNKPTEVA